MLHLHVAERADGLVVGLPDVLTDPSADPFAPAVLSVPTRGVERWLTQTLSHRLGATAGGEAGVAANIEFPFPSTLIDGAVSVATGFDPDADPWTGSRSVWPLLELVDQHAREPWLSLLATHLGLGEDGIETRRSRRASVVSHFARLFASYSVHRPEMVRAWAQGDDVDGSGFPLTADCAWQAELWRRLRTKLDAPSPAERIATACERLRADADLTDLPPSISVFGLTRLPGAHLEVLDALALHRDVHLFVLHPSQRLWEDLAATADTWRDNSRRADDRTLDSAINPLLASWGHDSREMQLVLDRGETTEVRHPVTHDTDTVLHRLQSAISANEAPPGPPAADEQDTRLLLADDDRSVQIHSCHGRERQVEVLRDAIMHLLADDPTLEPRDIIVMCPNVEDFAPLIHAVFGTGRLQAEEDEALPDSAAPAPPDLRVRLADRSLRRTNPVLDATSEILELASSRLTASQLLDFANLEPIRRRFDFDDDDLSRILGWINTAGIHWGIDEAHRRPFHVPVADGTWRRGLDRVLLGVAMSEDDARIFGHTLPVDDVESGAIALTGRFAELIDRLDAAFHSFVQPKSLGAWIEAITEAADALTATRYGEEWERLELDRLLEDMAADAGDVRADDAGPLLSLPEVRSLLTPHLAGRPTRANFRTGHISVCTLMPMRSVPHRVVCLLGLDHEAFPRKTSRDGDDLLLLDPHLADRDPRTEDRQLLLDALMAATDNLLITYTGNDERTNLEVPPAVPVGELIDVVDATVQHPEGARQRVVVRHPLQPFDRRNFDSASGPAAPEPWGFDHVNLAGARSLEREPAAPRPFLDEPLPPKHIEILELEELIKFVEHPVRAFLKQRLGIEVRDFFEEVEDDLPIELDGLGKWSVGNAFLTARRKGVDERAAVLAEIRRGGLPPEQLGKGVIDEQVPRVNEILALADKVLPKGNREACDVRIPLSGGAVLAGTIGGIEDGVLGTVTLSKVKPKQRLSAWVRLLALTVSRPDVSWEAITVGQSPNGRGRLCVARMCGLGDSSEERHARALEYLEVIVDLHRRGMREPLPIFCGASAAYFEALGTKPDPFAEAAGKFDSGFNFNGEIDDAEHRFVYPDIGSLHDLHDLDLRPDESGAGWSNSENTRIGVLAHRLWHLPSQHEQMQES